MGAREYFGEVRRAAERIEELGRTISGVEDGELAVGRIGGRVPRASGVGDPTATEAEARRRFVVAARAERDAALEVVGEALQVIEGLRRCFSRKAEVMEMYYVDRMEWDQAADAIGVGRATAIRWRDEMCDWLDASPRAYVMGCRFLDISQSQK